MSGALGNDPPYVRSADELDEDEQEAVIAKAIQEAIQFVETELTPDRAIATAYYQGKPLGNEMEGRSQARITEVRDGIIGAVPSLIRILHGPEHTVEYVPKRADTVAMAAQATDYARFVYEEDNKGFLITHALLKDGLLKKLGVVKWGLDETPEVRTTVYRSLSREQLEVLAADETAEVASVVDDGAGGYDVEARQVIPAGRIWVMPIPPDDFFWNQEARSLDDAILVGHRARLTRGELRAMGVSEGELDEYGGSISESADSLEEVARRQASVSGLAHDVEMGEENRRVLYCEAYMKLADETGVTSLRRICTLGPGYRVIKNVPADHLPFALFTPDPEPHAMLGGSWFDLLREPERINTALMRGMLDSLSISAFPRPVYVDGQVSVADVLNTAIGAPIRERLPNMVRWTEVPFTGDKVLPVMDRVRDIIERRIGQKDGAGSLDMDALQSTGKEAVNAAITAAQSQVELIARIFTEQVMKPMFRGILKLMPMSKDRIIRLRGNFVPVSPASWDADMDVSVNVALGTMNTEKKQLVLREVIADQSAILQEFGPMNPVVTVAMLRNAKAKLLDLSGIKDVESYYKPVPDDWQPPPPPPPEPSEDELWRQAEAKMAFEKNMKELAIKQDELALAARKQEAEERYRERELQIREADSIRDATTGPHNAEIERYKADQDHAAKLAQIESQERMERERLLVQLEIAKLNAGVKLDVADTQADAKAKAGPASG